MRKTRIMIYDASEGGLDYPSNALIEFSHNPTIADVRAAVLQFFWFHEDNPFVVMVNRFLEGRNDGDSFTSEFEATNYRLIDYENLFAFSLGVVHVMEYDNAPYEYML